MQSRRLIIDANILIRAVLGVRVRELIERYCESVAFYVAESNVEEAMEYLAELAPRRGIGDPVWQTALTSIMTAVQIIPQVELAAAKNEAMARIGHRDSRTGQRSQGQSNSIVRCGRKMKIFSGPALRPGRRRPSKSTYAVIMNEWYACNAFATVRLCAVQRCTAKWQRSALEKTT